MATGASAVKLTGRLRLAREITEVYGQSVFRKRNKIIDLLKDKAVEAKNSEIMRKIRSLKGYYTLEMAPPTSAQELAQLKEDINLVKEFMKSNCFKHLTVQQAWLLFLVGTEVYLWFYLGETIGKMHIVGYKVD